MKKLVNGKIVDIKNIELFEKAAEGMILSKIAISSIDTKITVESEVINECIRNYEIISKAMPFPLYAVESNIKYSAIATFIRDCMKEPLCMWVQDALFICVDEDKKLCLKFIGNTWGIVTVNECSTDNTSIENFRNDAGYKEFEWLLSKIMNKESTSSFYKEFMPDFVRACAGQSMIMKWELTNILNFGSIPNQMELHKNKIISYDKKSEYTLDIFSAGIRKTGENEYVLSLMGSNGDMKVKPKTAKVYDYDLFEKTTGTDGSKTNKVQKNSVIGIASIFNTLCSIKIAAEQPEFSDYCGIIVDGTLIYSVDNRIFLAKAYKPCQVKEIAHGVELFSYDRGLIYFIKSVNMGKGVQKETVYSYSIKDENLRLCRIQFNT